ncbi:MAG TPA: hypothetical protein QGH10_20650, partial [Armatimonadota bacterium]|nr:hypothetical protein [Armatimonadota bacterium]
TTVGWATPTSEITLDLGEHYAISGVLLGTVLATGTDVQLPERVEVLVSVNGRDYHLAGDLVEMDERPRPVGYNKAFQLQTDQLMVHGRYVKLIVHKGGRLFIFADEIEVHRGIDAWKVERPLPGPAIEYPMTLLENPFSLAFKARLDRDLRDARSAIEQVGVPDDVRARLESEADAIEEAMDALPELHTSEGFRGVFPLNEIHARTHALQGSLRAEQGRDALVAWRANPWDPLPGPAELPEEPPSPEVSVAAMRGETRAGAVNLTNCTDTDQSVTVTFEGLPGGRMPEYVTVREVAWTDTFAKEAIAAALPAAERDAQGWKISVPAGMTRQVWFEVAPRNVPPGPHGGEAILSGASDQPLRVPFALRVFDLDFPEKATLMLSGWDYSDRPSSATSYGVTHENVDAFIAHLRERHVSHTWASTWVMPHGTFSPDGSYRQTPDTQLFDEWIARWPGADGYSVYVFAPFWQGKIAGTGPEDPLFEKKMGEWVRFWADHARERGVLDQLRLVPVDEPHAKAPANAEMFIAWARAIKAAAPDLTIWLDPYPALPI